MRCPQDIVRADGAFVVPIANIVMYPCSKVSSSGLWLLHMWLLRDWSFRAFTGKESAFEIPQLETSLRSSGKRLSWDELWGIAA